MNCVPNTFRLIPCVKFFYCNVRKGVLLTVLAIEEDEIQRLLVFNGSSYETQK